MTHMKMLAHVSRVVIATSLAVLSAGCTARRESPVRLGDAKAVSAPTSVGTAPMFAVSSAGVQAVAWVSAPNGGTDGRLYVSVAGGPPTELRDSLGPIEAHGEAPPKLGYAPDGGLFAVYNVGKVVAGERFPRSALRLVSSHDGGKSWTSPITVTDGPAFGSHGFHALHVAPNGTVYVAWLGKSDGDTAAQRMTAMGEMSTMNHSAHAAHEASAAWITRSTDGGKTWSPRIRVDLGEACPCCRTALATSNDGTLYMAWRHVFNGNIRDVVVARSTDQGATWSEPIRVRADDWVFDACPHAGPAIATDARGVLHVAWWTGKEGLAGVFYAQSTDGGKTFAPATALGVARYSRPAHVQLALAPDNRVIVAWDDGTKATPQVVVSTSPDGGRHFNNAIAVSSDGRAASFPVLGVSHDSIAIAWSEVNAEQAATAVVAAPKDKNAPKGLEAIGDAQVVVRRGVLR
jgi:hypothetical protein